MTGIIGGAATQHLLTQYDPDTTSEKTVTKICYEITVRFRRGREGDLYRGPSRGHARAARFSPLRQRAKSVANLTGSQRREFVPNSD